MYKIEGSKRSSHSNAYMYGFNKSKRIVLFDSLIEGYKSSEPEEEKSKAETSAPEETSKAETNASEEKEVSKGCSNPEIIAILAHELGHWKLNHNIKNLLINEVILFV